MKYPIAEDVWLGDQVSLWRGAEGIVVCSRDTGECSGAYPEEAGLIHYIEPGPSLTLLRRAGQ